VSPGPLVPRLRVSTGAAFIIGMHGEFRGITHASAAPLFASVIGGGAFEVRMLRTKLLDRVCIGIGEVLERWLRGRRWDAGSLGSRRRATSPNTRFTQHVASQRLPPQARESSLSERRRKALRRPCGRLSGLREPKNVSGNARNG
jgi:hypothetical protein